jgi:beta-glucosidase
MTQHPYQDPSLPIEERVEDLLSRMTLDEKLAQLGCVWSTQLVATVDGVTDFSPDAAASLMPHGTGQVTRIAASTGLRPAGIARFHNRIQRWLRDHTRLGIPAVVHEEAVAGFCARDAVQFPQAIGLGATWDAELLEEIGEHIRTEMVAVGARQALSPVLDVARDPRWGRVEETYGEDPVLVGTLGAAYVRGIQSSPDVADPSRAHLRHGVVATGKHFCGYAASDGGRNHAPVHLGSRELREVHAEPFAAAIRDADLCSVMNSYASVDGLPPAGSRALLTELLRDELGFNGTVVADYFAVDLLRTHHRVAPTKGVAAARALLAGLDQELPSLDCYAQLGPLIDAGIVPEAVVDLSVRRVLRHTFALGLFEDPFVDEDAAPAAFGTPFGRDLARRAALESMVLLANDGVLPIDPAAVRSIAVLGPAADDPRLCEGDYHYPAHLEIIYGDAQADLLPQAGGAFAPGPHLPDVVTPLAGLRHALAHVPVEVTHAPGCSVSGPDRSGIDAAAGLARSADVAVVCLAGRSGLTPDATVGEARDATDLDPTGVQLDLLRAVHATGTPTVAVVVSGRVHTLAEVEAHSAATLLAWVPGVEGGTALAQLLLGDEAPSGRLPIALPRSVGQLPVHASQRAGGDRSQFWGDYTDAPASPLHPLGFGLSTTTFEYSALRIDAGDTERPTHLCATVTNTGARHGTEVVQCYVRDEVASVARPERQLVGFARVELAPGASATVHLELHPSRLAFHDEQFDLVVEPGVFTVELGGCAGEPALTGSFELDGDITAVAPSGIVATRVRID